MSAPTALAVAERWFERRRIDDDIVLLWEPHVHPLLRCNIWHVSGRHQDLLVDSGLGVASLRAAAHDLFERRPVLGVATHAHMDHIGGAAELDQVAIHRAEAEALRTAANHLPLDPSVYDDPTLGALAAMGYDISDGLLDALPHAGFDPAGHLLAPAQPTRLLAEGDVIDLGHRAFEVLHLPGHSPGSIGLWDAANATLFSGDAIYDGPLLDQIPGADVEAYIATMRRLRDLPVEVVHAGHDPSFGRSRLVELVDDYLRRQDHAGA